MKEGRTSRTRRRHILSLQTIAVSLHKKFFLQGNCFREENVVFQVNMVEKIVLKLLKFCEGHLICCTGISRQSVIFGQGTDGFHRAAGGGMFHFHHVYWSLDRAESWSCHSSAVLFRFFQ